MASRHRIEVFTEGCSSCEGAVAYAHELAASGGADMRVWDVRDAEAWTRMNRLGITQVPAIAVDGEPLVCCGRPTKGEDGARA